MTRKLTSDWDWALKFTGDPSSHQARSESFLTFLVEEGMTPNDHVLDLGCGCLAPGAALIRYLDADRYTGIEPFGLLVNVALRQFPDLEAKNPQWLWRDDFDATETGVSYPFAIAHSLLSHVAHWQMEACLQRVRAVMPDGAVWLATVRLDQYNDFREEFAYPGVSRFRIGTIMAMGAHAGWRVERCLDYEERLQAVAPNDFHEILRFTAVPSLAELNERRLAEEAVQSLEREVRDADEAARITALEDEDEARRAEVGL